MMVVTVEKFLKDTFLYWHPPENYLDLAGVPIFIIEKWGQCSCNLAEEMDTRNAT